MANVYGYYNEGNNKIAKQRLKEKRPDMTDPELSRQETYIYNSSFASSTLSRKVVSSQ